MSFFPWTFSPKGFLLALAGAWRPSCHSSKLLCSRPLSSGWAFAIPPNRARLDGYAVALFHWVLPDDDAGAFFCIVLLDGRAALLDDGAGALFRLAPLDDGTTALFRWALLDHCAPPPDDHVATLFRAALLNDCAISPDDGAGVLFCLAPPNGHALEVLPFFRLHPSSTPHQFYPLGFFFVTFFSCGIFQLPSFTYFELFSFSKYTSMAPPNRARSYYYEFCSKTLVPGANFEEHKVGAIHRGLLEASGKMMRCQLQMFREDLKVSHRKQKLLAKRAILDALRESVEPSNWCVPFFSFNCVLSGFFFLFIRVFFFFFGLLPHDLVYDQKLHRPTFSPLRVGTRAWNKPYIGGLRRVLGSSTIFDRKGSISRTLWKTLLGSIMRRRRNWGWKNETQPWMVFESFWRIVSWFMKGLWLPSCCTSLFCPIKPSNILPRWPTCGSLADASLGLVPPRLRWPCLDTNSTTTIVSLPVSF